VLVCGVANPRQAQGVRRKARPKPAEAKPAVAKPEAKPAAAVPGNAEPTLIGQFGTWGAYTACRMAKGVLRARQTSSSKNNPPNRPRDPAYAFRLHPPGREGHQRSFRHDRLCAEAGSESTLEVGGAAYSMYTRGDGVWIKNAAEEERMWMPCARPAMRRSKAFPQGHRDHGHLSR